MQKQTTAYDGFYTFSRVPVGAYCVHVVPSASDPDGATASDVSIRIPPDGAYMDGIDLTLTGGAAKN